MNLFVLKNPTAETLAKTAPADGAGPPIGWESMTDAEFEAWRSEEIANGWAPPVAASDAVPPEVGAYQIREAMIRHGFFVPETPQPDYKLLDAWIEGLMDMAITNAAQNAAAKRAWRTATAVKRGNEFLPVVAWAAGKTEAEVDELFRLAVTL